MEDASAALMQSFLSRTSDTHIAEPSSSSIPSDGIFTGYDSGVTEDDCDWNSGDEHNDSPKEQTLTFHFYKPPPPKRQKRDISEQQRRRLACNERRLSLAKGLQDLDKLLRSKKDVFDASRNGLQACRARAMSSCLHMVLEHNRGLVEASLRAAECHGFSPKWGSRQVHQWVNIWVGHRELPASKRGHHIKTWTLLNEPLVVQELASFMRSEKWCMDPKKLANLTMNKLVPEVAKPYLKHLVEEEMPKGLKKYVELELFPRIHYRAGTKGIVLRTAQWWLHKYGFYYTDYRKGTYYDGHEREDVVAYRQKEFLPQMALWHTLIVEYEVGNVEKEVEKIGSSGFNCVERRLVFCAHDEMTAQANDGKKKGWLKDGENPLRKKEQGRGIHQSDVICSTVGWLKDASQTLEYGKNYDRYWTGEMFVKQLKDKIIPAFEKAHGPGYRAIIAVDNSQVTQSMVFPPTHPKYPNLPKGMKEVLLE
ncbi:hypothetical protein C8Q75DRAFT_767684 [Abortiporus biennis]|nr:hypothetical protein C8Q75DRAFT_767684 [Abortiporus biennis]